MSPQEQELQEGLAEIQEELNLEELEDQEYLDRWMDLHVETCDDKNWYGETE